MSLLHTIEFIDLVELNRFVTEKYSLPELGSSDSFHRQVSEALDYPGQDSMCYIEIALEDAEDAQEWLADYNEDYQKVVKVFWRLQADGHLPKREEFTIKVWW